MPTFVLLTRLPPDAAWTAEALEALRVEATRRLQDDDADLAATLVLVHGRVRRKS